MNKAIPRRISLPVIFFIAIVLTVFTLFLTRSDDLRLAEAAASYHEGEVAKTITERKKTFNEALQLYQALASDYNPMYGTGKLYYNLGNTYFQLEEYPLAILNYLRAEPLMPRDEKVKSNLSVAKKKISLDVTETKPPFSSLLFFHYSLSLPERLQLFFAISVFVLGFSVAYVWNPLPWLKRGLAIFVCLLLFPMISLMVTRYFSPTEAVIVHATDLRRDAGTQYAKVGVQPLSPGTTVEVIDTMSDNLWIKIASPKGDPGFVPIETIRMVYP